MAKYSKPGILDEINSFKRCEVALLTTFNFDISFFDRSLLSMFYSNRTRVCIFADAKQFQESINNDQHSKNIGKYYFVQPFRMEKTFHPKLILLLAKNRAKLIVASANLTYSSYYSNNEIFQSFSYDEENTEYLALFIRAFKFFVNISNESNSNYIKEQIDYCKEKYPFLLAEETNRGPLLLTSYNESIISQTLRNINDDIKEITVATPFYDEELGALSYLKKRYKEAKINLYIQDYHSTFPKEKYSDDLISTVNVFESVNNNEHKQKQFYHGKVFCFRTANKEYVLYGSPNFSISALINSYKNGGNLEAAILDQGNIGECNEFFKSLIIKNDVVIGDLQTNKYENESKQADNGISFVNGFISGKAFVQVKSNLDLNLCSVRLNNHSDVLIEIEKYNNGIYTLCFNKELLESNVFDLVFDFNDKTISIRCFVCNIDYLNDYIRSSNKNPFAKLTTQDEMENYNKALFLERFSEITSDIRMGIQQKNADISNQQSDVNDDTIEEEDEENTALDSIMYESSNSEIVIGNHDTYLKADAYLLYFAGKTSSLLSGKSHGYRKSEENINNLQIPVEEKKRRIGQKQSFSSKLLGWFRNYASLENEKLNGLDFYTYFNIYELISGTFICDLYINKAGIKSLPELIEVKIDYILNRIIPNIDNQAQLSSQYEYLKKEIALLCIECYFVRNDLPFNVDKFKEELFKLDRLYANTFIDELKLLIKEVCTILEIDGYFNIISYFDNFFINAPKTDELEKIINKHFGFKSSSFNITFIEQSSLLNIEINAIEKKSSSSMISLNLMFIENIINYINRQYGDKINDTYSFIIDIQNYSEFILNLRYEWNSNEYRKYKQIRKYKNAIIVQNTLNVQNT